MAETKSMFETVGTGKLPPGLVLHTLRSEPRIFVVYKFLGDKECEHMINLVKDNLKQSSTVDADTGEQLVNDNRTSKSCFLKLGCDEVVATIEKRIEDLICLPARHGDQFNVLRYQVGQEYGAHDDFFDPALPGVAATLKERGQRFLTLLLYLNTVQSGGETIFPKVGFEFPPVKGSILIFYNVLSDGNIDRLSRHGSTPVKAGEKWVATKWIRQYGD